MTMITSIGTANPPFKCTQRETAELIEATLTLKPAEKRMLHSVYKATGIEQRHSVLSDYCKKPGTFDFFPNDPSSPFPTTAERMKIYKDHALDLALLAIADCLNHLDSFNKKTITHLITVSCTGMYAPGLDIEIVQHLALSPTTKRTAINFMGCYGAFNGLKLAEAICSADANAKVLLICVELCTIHFQKSMKMDNLIANAIFADGAAAVLVQNFPAQNNKGLTLTAFHCDLLPQSSQEMAWHIGDSGFDIALSTYVPDMIQAGILAFAKQILNQEKLTFSEIDFFAIHPGGQKILKACEEALGIQAEDNRFAYQVLRQYGNMSSPTVLFVLKEIWTALSPADHQKTIFSCAFGPGLTIESMLLKTHYC